MEKGVVRVIKPNDWVAERTYRDGRIHGLNRLVGKDQVRVSLFKDGQEIAYFVFGRNLVESDRGGSHAHLLDQIKPEMFVKHS